MPWRAPQVKEKNPRTSATPEASSSGAVPAAMRSRPASASGATRATVPMARAERTTHAEGTSEPARPVA